MEFFMLTPGPGSQDHQELYLKGVAMSPDTNQYDSEHAVTAHARMTSEEWEDIYKKAWHLYYSPRHVETLLRRAAATKLNTGRVASMIFYFYASHAFEGVHPLQSGVFRRKRRSQRRASFPRESAIIFYPRRIAEIFATYVPALWYLARLELIRWRIRRDPDRKKYSDVAISPAAQDDNELFELYLASQPGIRYRNLLHSDSSELG